MLAEPRRIDVSHPALPYVRRDDEFERPFEPPKLDSGIRQRFAALERGNRRVRIGRSRRRATTISRRQTVRDRSLSQIET
jgi:hypothetical protein